MFLGSADTRGGPSPLISPTPSLAITSKRLAAIRQGTMRIGVGWVRRMVLLEGSFFGLCWGFGSDCFFYGGQEGLSIDGFGLIVNATGV